jgi:hypothetical protein
MQSGNSEDLCRTQVEVKLISDSVKNLLQLPLGNHLILVKGHHKEELQEWWKNMIA